MQALKSKLLNLVGVIIAVYLTVSLTQTISRNYGLQQEVDKLRSDIAKLEDEKEELSYKIQYYQTDAYKEKEARAKLGLKKPGEEVVIFSQEEAQPTQEENQDSKPPSSPNWRLWWEFIFG